MYVSLNSNINTTPDFRSACKVRGVNLNGEYYGRRRNETIYQVTRVLYDGMIKKTLSKDIIQKINSMFPDFCKYPFAYVARGADKVHQRFVSLLMAYDAQEYKNLLDMGEEYDVRNWKLNRIISRSGDKQIIISAEERDGKITITNIERYKK